MRKILKSKKALSPVVAAIILIAVTVAVSIAVAAWMGALTFTFMKTEELKVISHSWGTNNANIVLTVKNTGTSALSVSDVLVKDVVAGNVAYGGAFTGTGPWTLDAGQQGTITITQAFSSGVKYEFAVRTATGNKYTYIATAL